LDALSSDGFELVPEYSEDSGSANHSDDGLSDVGSRTGASDEEVRRHSQVVQQRIDACRAAIYRHKMTIETLQYSFAEEGQDISDQPVVPLSSIPAHGSAVYGSKGMLQLRDRAGSQLLAPDTVGAPQDSRCRAGTPAVVVDRIARLKRRCVEGLGSEQFQAARQCLQALLNAGEVAEAVRSEMLGKLGLEKIGFYSLIDQIVYMECRWGHGDAAPQELA